MTGTEIVEEVLAELAALADPDLNTMALNGLNAARRTVQNVKGGRLRWLRKRFSDVAVVATTQYITFDSDLRIIDLLWNLTEQEEIVYKPEMSWRGTEGVQQTSDTPGKPTWFTLDLAPGAAGEMRAELWPISDGTYSLAVMGYRKLDPIAVGDLGNEIYDVPTQLHEHLVTLCRYYMIQRIPKAADLLKNSFSMRQLALRDVASFDLDTGLESIRIPTKAEQDRQANRIKNDWSVGSY